MLAWTPSKSPSAPPEVLSVASAAKETTERGKNPSIEESDKKNTCVNMLRALKSAMVRRMTREALPMGHWVMSL